MRSRPGVSWMARKRSARSGALGQVVAVGLHRLAQERDLAHAALGQHRHLVRHLGDGPAALAAAAVGDDAEGAELVAAVDDGHVGGGPRWLGEGAGPELAAQVFVRQDGGQHVGEGLGAGEDIDEGEALLELLAAQAHHAAHDGDLQLAVALGLEPPQRAQLAHGPLLGLLADAAGVEHDQVGLLGAGRLQPAEAVEAGGQLGRIGLVHLTAHRPDVVARHVVLGEETPEGREGEFPQGKL